MVALYWISTVLVCLMLAWSAGTYVFSDATIEGVRALGFPDHFRWMLAVLKVLAVAALLIPGVPEPVREWAYAGVGLFFLTALVAHIAHGDSLWLAVILVAFMGLLAASRWTWPTVAGA